MMKALFISCAMLALFNSSLYASDVEHIRDEGKFFSPAAVQSAEAQLGQLHAKTRRAVLVETYDAIPSSRSGFDPAKKDEFFAAWARERLSASKEKGVLVLICRQPTYLYVAENSVDNNLRKELTSKLLESFKKKEYDQGLAIVVEFAEVRLGGKTPVEAGATASASTAAAASAGATHAQGSSSSGVSTIIVIAVAVLGFLFVLALFRSMAGGGMGGGGGFFSGLMGGIAGAFVGNWLYNSFAGSSDTPGESGDSSSDASADDIDGGGGDFGGDIGGGDF
jgi:uncharacterized membrane protein YgcG